MVSGARQILGLALDRIPEQVAGDEDVGVMEEESLEPLLDQDDPLELERVLGHGLTVVVGVLDRGWLWLREDRAHRRHTLGRS